MSIQLTRIWKDNTSKYMLGIDKSSNIYAKHIPCDTTMARIDIRFDKKGKKEFKFVCPKCGIKKIIK